MARLKITQPCDRCGKSFHPWPKRKEQERRQFCSVGCREIPELERFWLLVDKAPGFGPNGDCWKWQGRRDKDGYGMFYRSKSFTTTRAHRYSYELHKDPIPEGLQTLHSCDNPPCVRPDHLSVGTAQDNATDKVAKGRAQRGENHGRALVTEEGGISQTALGAEYGLEQTSVSQIIRGTSWSHVAFETAATPDLEVAATQE